MQTWGILGLGQHGSRVMLPAFTQAASAKLLAIASISKTKHKNTTPSKLPLGCRLLESYQELLENSDIEAIYIALPNHLHTEWSNKAILAGKHVLCEKPSALLTKDLTATIALANDKKLTFREALMYRLHPQHQAVKEILLSGRLGEPRLVEAHFHYSHQGNEGIRLTPECGGGALLDVGCYLIDSTRFLFNEEPRWASAVGYTGAESKVDESMLIQLAFPNGRAAHLSAGCRFGHENYYTIYGTKGRLTLQDAYLIPRNKQSTIEIEEISGKKELLRLPPANPYVLGIEEFSRLSSGTKNASDLLGTGLENLRIISAVREAAKTAQTVAIGSE